MSCPKAMREGNSVVLKGLKFSGGELSAAQLPRHPQTWQEMEVGPAMRREVMAALSTAFMRRLRAACNARTCVPLLPDICHRR